MKAVNLFKELELVNEYWSPRVIGEVVARDGAARVDLTGKLEFDA